MKGRRWRCRSGPSPNHFLWLRALERKQTACSSPTCMHHSKHAATTHFNLLPIQCFPY